MFELGKKSEIFGAELLTPLQIWGRPTAMPPLGLNEDIVCGYDQGLGERMIVCESLDDMQELYDNYARGGALNIHWYKAPEVGFITAVTPPGTVDNARLWDCECNHIECERAVLLPLDKQNTIQLAQYAVIVHGCPYGIGEGFELVEKNDEEGYSVYRLVN